MSPRAFIIHGYLSYPEEAWLPWLKRELENEGCLVSLPAMPQPSHPVISEWIPFIAKLVGTPDAATFLIGHSLGCQAVLRYLETIGAAGRSVAKTVLVAGMFPLGMSSTEAAKATEGNSVLIPWFTSAVDPFLVKAAAGQCTVILSDRDPYIDVAQATETFRATLDPQIVIVRGGGHFNEDDRVTQLPEALNALLPLKAAGVGRGPGDRGRSALR